MQISRSVYEHIESCLKELSDLEFQERVWLRGEGPEVSSYVEVVCQLFDDTGIGDQLDLFEDSVVLSADLDPVLREMNAIFGTIDYQVGAEKILQSQKWPRVIELATQALGHIPSLTVHPSTQ